jgi:hypothetical protein
LSAKIYIPGWFFSSKKYGCKSRQSFYSIVQKKKKTKKNPTVKEVGKMHIY